MAQGSRLLELWLDGGFIEVKVAHVKEERQPKRYAHQKTADNRDPKSSHTEAPTLCKDKDPEHN
jgi:hypothetical protein